MGTTRKRSAGSGTVLARSNGTFTAQITDAIEGRRRSIGTFATRKDAEKALAVALVEGPPPSLTLTLGDYLGLFIADCALTLKATTLARYHSCLRAYIEPHPIARKRIANLRPDDFRSLYRDLADHGKRDGSPLAPASIATVDRMLKASLQRLVDDRTLIFHPIPRRVIRVPRTERPWLNLEQVRDLLRFARFVAPDLEVPLRLAALAGLRRGEVLGLRWTDIDLEGAAAQIRCSRSAAGGIAVESTPKTAGSMAQVALDPETVAALRRHQGRRAAFIETDVGATEYVVCNFDGTGLDPNRLGKSFRSLRDSYDAAHPAGELPPVSFHDLRHSFASNLVASGVNLKVVSEALRHSSIRMTADRYSHLAPSTLGEVTRALAAQVDGL